MFNIVLFEPEIPPNTGNIMRLCVNTNSRLHLIEPMGFRLDDKQLKRAGLDYKEKSIFTIYQSIDEYLKQVSDPSRIFLCTTKASGLYTDSQYQKGDHFILGPESRGLPNFLLELYPDQQKIKIPMSPDGRSLNLATAAAIITYEAWRQCDFKGARI